MDAAGYWGVGIARVQPQDAAATTTRGTDAGIDHGDKCGTSAAHQAVHEAS